MRSVLLLLSPLLDHALELVKREDAVVVCIVAVQELAHLIVGFSVRQISLLLPWQTKLKAHTHLAVGGELSRLAQRRRQLQALNSARAAAGMHRLVPEEYLRMRVPARGSRGGGRVPIRVDLLEDRAQRLLVR